MKMKKLLASALAATMVLSSMVGAMVTSAATTVGTITAGTVNAYVGETDSVTVPVTINFPEGVDAPHNIVTVALDGYNLTDVQLGEVVYLTDAQGKVTFEGLADGKILLEAPVDETAPKVQSIALTVTFTDADEDDTVAGEYDIVVNGDDMTNINEEAIGIDAANGKLIVEEKHVCAAGEATPNNDGTHDIPCTGCDMLIADDEKCTYVDGKCSVCGYAEPVTGPVVDSNLVFYRTSLAYGTSSLEFNFRIANTVLDLYNNVELVIIPQKYDMTTLDLVETPAEIVIAKADLAAAGSRYKQYTYKDIQLYELGLNIDYMLRAYDANGELVAVSEKFNTSISDVLKTMSNDITQAAGLRTLMVNTLVVCDEVMKNVAKSYPDSDLASASSVLEGADMTLATQEIGECNDVNDFVSYDANFVQTSGATHQIRSSVAIGKVPYINFRVRDAKNALDLSKLEINVKYTSVDSAGSHPYDKTFSGADLTDGTFINCVFAEIGFHDSNKDILFTVSYDGEKKCEWTYSMETYLNSMTTDATVGAQCIALIKLGQSFRTYQGL